jgi:DNA repair protein SbcC/Rad50
MRPIKLALEGFTSFRQRTEIDFTGLDLFAITGPTGSGKTSIIDAITYSLYGQTARLGGKGLGELINQGSSRLAVLLEFESGGKRYRVARVLKRSGPASVRLELVEGDGVHCFDGGAREIAAQVAKIVGLDFDAFTKAVVLPQGKFDEFLRGDPAERREILEVLLNLGMYREMMQRANTRHKERQTERDLIASQLQREYADATGENRQVLAEAIKKLSSEAALLNAELTRVEDLRTPAIELRQKREISRNSERDLEAAKEQLASEQKKETKLVNELQQREKDFHQLEQELRQVPYDEKVYEKLLALRPVAQQLEKTERERVAKVQENSKKSSELNELAKKLETAKRSYKQIGEKSQIAKDGYNAAREKFVALKKKYGPVEIVEDVAEEMKHMDELELQLQRDQQEQAELEKKRTDLSGRIEKLEMEEAQAKRLYSEAQDAYESIVRKHSAEDLRKHLQTGEPCPVCDQVVARLPKRLPTAKLDEAKAAAQERRDAWHKKQGTLAKAEADWGALPSQLQSAKANVVRTSKQITEIVKKAERILGRAPGVNGPTQLKRVTTELRAAESACASKEVESKKVAEEEASTKDAFVRVERDLAVLTENIDSLKRQIEGAATEIEQLRARLEGMGDSKSIQTELGAQERAKQRRTEITGKMEHVQKAREQFQKQQAEVNAQVAGLKGKVEILKATVEKANSESVQIELSLKTKLVGLTLPRGRDEAEQIDKLLGDLRQSCSELTRQIEQKQARADQIEIRIAEAEQKRARITELEHAAFLYAQLGALLRADQFIQFVLEGAFALLCSEGTRQLMTLSQGRYSFCTEGNEFQVIDHWNADERRSVRTLSGGESFLASLGLALALSSSVSQFADGSGPFKLDALFLDEGFSTLDAETLNTAVEAIQALQEGDRMIAVISHVTDLAERLPSRIQVIKGVSGSEISLDQLSGA